MTVRFRVLLSTGTLTVLCTLPGRALGQESQAGQLLPQRAHY
jgi:hypothetical protein